MRIVLCLIILSWICCTAQARADSVWLKARQTQYAAWRAAHPDVTTLNEIWDSADAPRMTLIPAGEFVMGSPASEAKRSDDEGPRHQVRIDYSLAVSTYPITVGEFSRFISATHYAMHKNCEPYQRQEGKTIVYSWRSPSFSQNEIHPVVCVSWTDAQAYVAWLSQRTGHRYRLLSEAEYEYAARAGTTSIYWWGSDGGAGHANCRSCGNVWDGKSTSPVDSFPPNAFGLYDMAGNVWSWTSDCWNPSYDAAPGDGTAATEGQCDLRVLRGGSWYFSASSMRSASRYWVEQNSHFYDVGLRVARSL